jgi:hypothetical protein
MAVEIPVMRPKHQANAFLLDVADVQRSPQPLLLPCLATFDVGIKSRSATGGAPVSHTPQVGSVRSSPWATTGEGAEYVRCPNRDAFRKWARRAGIIPAYRGRVPLYAWRDIDRALGVRAEQLR